MFRTGLLVKFGIVRISSSCPLVQTSVKWCSTSASPSIRASDLKTDECLSSEPAWVKTPLDKKIYHASDAHSLLSFVDNQSFDGKCAINVVNILSRWVAEGKFTAEDFQKLKQRVKLEENLLKGEFNVGIVGTLQVFLLNTVKPCISSLISALLLSSITGFERFTDVRVQSEFQSC